MEPSGFGGGINSKIVAQAFGRAHGGYSADRVIADPELNAKFLVICNEFGLTHSPSELNHALMNLRKSGGALPKTKNQTSFDDSEYQFSSEIAIRILERRDGVTLDDVLCDPARAKEFDQLAAALVPGYSPLEYRWSALSLRKERSLKPEFTTRLLRPNEVHLVRMTEIRLESIPRLPGIYVFLDTLSKQVLYVGEASSLRSRLKTHLDHSDNRMLARHLWEHGFDHVQLEYYVLPEGTSKRELRAIELEHIQLRHPQFNISGQY